VIEYFDMDGNAISFDAFLELYDRANDKRRVALDETPEFYISTVLLGLNHEWRTGYPPLIFETMIFTRGADGGFGGGEFQMRYSTKEEALLGHAAAVRYAKSQGAIVTEFRNIISCALTERLLK